MMTDEDIYHHITKGTVLDPLRVPFALYILNAIEERKLLKEATLDFLHIMWLQERQPNDKRFKQHLEALTVKLNSIYYESELPRVPFIQEEEDQCQP